MEKINLNLKNARKLSGLTAKQASKKVNISIDTLFAYENKKRYPRVDIAKQLANTYGFEFNEINFF